MELNDKYLVLLRRELTRAQARLRRAERERDNAERERDRAERERAIAERDRGQVAAENTRLKFALAKRALAKPPARRGRSTRK
jgi:hypothetical protein